MHGDEKTALEINSLEMSNDSHNHRMGVSFPRMYCIFFNSTVFSI